MSERPCSACGEFRDGAHQSYCKACLAEYVRERRAASRSKYNEAQRKHWNNLPIETRRSYKRKYHLMSVYGLTLEQYDELYEKQERCCAICKDELPKSGRNVHVDHCHETGNVRGILCSRCNTGIGHLRHDPHIIEAAINYLMKAEV